MHSWLSLTIIPLLIICELSAQSTNIDSSKVIPAPGAGLVDVPLPQLDRLEEAVARQIDSFQRSFLGMLAKGRPVKADLTDGYSALGQLYHAYELIESAESCYLNATHLAPSDYRWLYLLGSLYHKSGKLSEAVHYYKLVRLINEEYVAAASNLGDVYLQLGQLAEARQEFLVAVEKAPEPAAALNGLGQVALAEGKYEEAVKYFQATLARIPAANRVHYSLAMAYRGLGDLENAQSHLQQRGTVGVRPIDPHVDKLKVLLQGERVFMIQGRLALSAGRYGEAAAAFARAVEAKPSSVRGRINLGVSLVQIDSSGTAIKQFRAALKYDPDNLNAHFNLGVELSKKNEFNEAITHFQTVLRLNPDDIEARRGLAKALVKAQHEEDAINHFLKVIERVPADEPSLLSVSALLVEKSRYKEARHLLDRANRRFPERGLTAHDLARLLAACPDTSLRNGKRALELATKVYETRNTPTHAETLAMALAEVGRCDEAATLQRQLVDWAAELKKNELVVRFKRDLVRYEKGRPCRPGGPQ